MSDSPIISAETTLQTCIAACEERKADQVEAYDLRGESVIADYLVICSGQSTPQLRAIQVAVEKNMRTHGINVRHVEGKPESLWILLDYGDVIVHVFHPDSRDFYRIEDLISPSRKIYPKDDSGDQT